MKNKILYVFILLPLIYCIFVNIVIADTLDTFDFSFGIDKTVSASIKSTNSSNDTNPNGYSITGDFLYYFSNGSSLGAGINYNPVEDNNFYLTNVYAIFKQLIPINTDVNFFTGIGLGSNCNYGKLFCKAFCGIDINKLMFFLNYSQNYITYKGSDISYSKLAMGVGLRFNVKNSE